MAGDGVSHKDGISHTSSTGENSTGAHAFVFNADDKAKISQAGEHARAKLGIHNPHFNQLFESGLTGLASHITIHPDGSAFVSTGDIPDEWLRDSTAQVKPLVYFAKDDKHIAQVIKGAIAQQATDIQKDPYANAFKPDGSVWERKFEVDSLTAPISLAWTYWKQTGDTSVFTSSFSRAMDTVVRTFKQEQDHSSSGYNHKDVGHNPTAAGTGMIWTGFRPSDDPSKFNFNIPDEMQAVVALGQISEIEKSVYHKPDAAKIATDMRAEVHEGIQNYGIVNNAKYGPMYAYEVDGLGHALLEDDANVPSLLSSPYSGYLKQSDPIYQNTRRFLLSKDNPTYYAGKTISGIGSHHTPHGYVWPLALAVQSITANSNKERHATIDALLSSDPGDHKLHESFNPDNPKQFTRKDFSWPNAFFSEVILAAAGDHKPLPVPSTQDLIFRSPTDYSTVP